jgi:hypothetical protein
MSGGLDGPESDRRRRKACLWGVAVVLAVAETQVAAAAAFPDNSEKLGAWRESGVVPVADKISSFSVKDIQAEPGTEAPIAIKLPTRAELRRAGSEEGAFLLVRNIPEGVGLSAGMATGRVWVVPLREVLNLRLLTQPGVPTRFQLEFHLMGLNKSVLAEATITVDLAPSRTVAAISPAAPEPEAAEQPHPPVHLVEPPRPEVEPLSPEAEAVLMTRGNEILQQGGIAAARLIFEEVAKHGSPAGALALARTYDPAYALPAAAAPTPNMAEARKWYERAAELGNPDAKQRLAEIASGR